MNAVPEESPFVDELQTALVDPQLVGHAVVGDVEIDAVVAAEIPGDDAESVAARLVDAGLGADVGEAPAAVVAVEHVRLRRLEVVRVAVDPPPRSGETLDVGSDRPAQIVRYVEIQVSVAVGVEEDAARAPVHIADSGVGGDVREPAVALVAVEDVRPQVGDVDVGVSVAVVVRHGAAHAIAPVSDPGALRHIPEAKVPEVPVQAVPRRISSLRGDLAALHQVDVEEPVPVVIEEENAAGEDLRIPEPLLAGRVEEVDARTLGSVLEPRGSAGLGGPVRARGGRRRLLTAEAGDEQNGGGGHSPRPHHGFRCS